MHTSSYLSCVILLTKPVSLSPADSASWQCIGISNPIPDISMFRIANKLDRQSKWELIFLRSIDYCCISRCEHLPCLFICQYGLKMRLTVMLNAKAKSAS